MTITPETSDSDIFKAIACLAAASFLFASTGVIIRFLAEQGVGTSVVVFYRNAFGLLVMLPLLMRNGAVSLKTDNIGGHLLRSLVGISAMYAFFYAVANYSLADAMLFVYAAPVFVPLAAHIILGEPVVGKHYIAACTGLAGIACVFQPGNNLYEMAFTGSLCTLMSATAFVVVRKLSFTEPAERIVFYFSLFGTLFTVGPMLVFGQHLTWLQLGWLLGIGCLTTSAQWCLTRGYGLAPAGRVAPTSYLTVIIAGFYGWMLWGEVPSLLSLAGYLVVFCAVIVTMPAGQKTITPGQQP